MKLFLYCLSFLIMVGTSVGECNNCTYYYDMDFDEANIADLPAANSEECCDLCINLKESKCNSWSFYQGICYLKGNALVMIPRSGVISGFICPPKPTTVSIIESSEGASTQFAKKTNTYFVDLHTRLNTKYDTTFDKIYVDPSVKYQSIYGFGGAFTEATAYNLNRMSKEQQEEIMSLYFGSPETSLGYSMCRTHMNSCDFCLDSYSCDDVVNDYDLDNFNIEHDKQYILPMIQKALELSKAHRDLKIFASPWSPPAWMKSNGKMTGSYSPGLIQDEEIFKSWALFFSKFIDAYEAEGVSLWGITPQNEPEYAANWEACVYNPQQMSDFISQYLGPLLKSKYPDKKIIAFDHNRDHVHIWAKDINNDDASNYVDGFGFHWYTGNSPGLNMYENLDAAHFTNTSKFLLGTEATYCPGVELGAWYRGEAYGIDILNDLLHWSVGWVDWNMVLDTTGGPNHLGNMCDAPIIVDPVAGKFYLQPTYFFMGHFSKYIEPGSYRVNTILNRGQHCMRNIHASNTDVCNSIQWACDNMVCDDDWRNCDDTVLDDNAALVFDKWYQEHSEQGPSACDFGGAAHLEGVQAVAFEKPNHDIVLIVLNVGQRGVSYHILDSEGKTAPMYIKPHAIQTLHWSPSQ